MREAYCGAEMRFQSSPSLRVMYARGFGSLMIRFILRIGDSSCRGPWRSAFFHQAFEANKVRAQNFVHHHFDAFPSSPSLRVMYARGFGSLMIRFILTPTSC